MIRCENPGGNEGDGIVKPAETRADFPLLKEIIYLDSAATSLSPVPVIEAVSEYDRRYRANVGRGVHRLSQFASQRYWDAHRKVSDFIGGNGGTLVFVRNTTEAINAVAAGTRWEAGDRIVSTLVEHHSNFLPWLRLRGRGVDLSLVRPRLDGTLDTDAFAEAIDRKTRLVAVTHASNVLGTLLPVEEIAAICRDNGARLLVDGAQSAPHIPVDVAGLGCDYFCFSGHKMLGPTGTGVLWMKEADLDPLFLGGGTVKEASAEGYELVEGYERFEAGTPNISGGIGLGRAVDYLRAIGMDEIVRHEHALTRQILEGLFGLDRVTVHGPGASDRRIGVVSFTVEGIHPHEVAHILDEAAAIMVRSGEHCCRPLMKHLGLPNGTVRASVHVYNTAGDIERLIATVEEITRIR